MNNALCKIINIIGSEQALAARLGITQQAVSQWFKKGVPPARIPKLIKICNGEVTERELRPDIYDDT
jgi:DNA-binding transcriptional regulator YdaS (Cro superfamily)